VGYHHWSDKGKGVENATIGIEIGHSPRMIAGYLFVSEYELLKESLPNAKFVNALDLMDEATFVKDPEEIKLLRQAAAIADAYLRTSETLITSLKSGSRVGDVWKTVNDMVTSAGYVDYTLPAFGHGIGVLGHEWYPAILDNDEFRDIVLEENLVEIAILAMNVPGVGGMRLECPVRVTSTGGG
jgi:Xaa-Pro aminopeptidase